MHHRLNAAQWARNVLNMPGLLVLDTATTGLQAGEIVSIAIINGAGECLLDTFVKPAQPIPAGATAIHGITDEHVANARSWTSVAYTVLDILRDQNVVVYNAVYDRRMLYQSGEANGMEKIPWRLQSSWYCAMEAYAEFWGDYDSYHHSYTWQRLTVACEEQNIPEPEAPAHSALGDCYRTLALLKVMAAADQEVQP